MVLLLFSCNNGKHEIIAKWDNGKIKAEKIYFDTPTSTLAGNIMIMINLKAKKDM